MAMGQRRMSLLDRFDFVNGDIPKWLQNVVGLARPAVVTMTVAIPSLGAFTVGMVAAVAPEAAMRMAMTSVIYLKGIPDAAWGAITAIALGYTVAKSTEMVKRGGTAAAGETIDRPVGLVAAEPGPATPLAPSPTPATGIME